MKRQIVLALSLVLAACGAPAASLHTKPPGTVQPYLDPAEADRMVQEAIALMDAGRIDEAIALLDRVIAAKPDYVFARYEKAFAFYLKKDFRAAARELEPLREGESSPRVYQLLGNCHDELRDLEAARATYAEGIRRFPDAGFLYYDAGVAELSHQKADLALASWERGMRAAPEYPSNYAAAAKLLVDRRPLLAMIHAETAMNLERGTPRTAEMSAIVRHAFAGFVAAWKQPVLEIAPDDDPFIMVLAMSIITAAAAENVEGTPTYEQLLRVRSIMLAFWNDEPPASTLARWQLAVSAAGHGDAYGRWVLGIGDEQAGFGAWCDGHAAECEGFVTWLKTHPMPVG